MKLLLGLALALGLAGCTAGRNAAPQKADVAPHITPSVAGQRFAPTGSDPEIALDTESGSLCRTVALTPRSAGKYAKLPMCATGDAASISQPVVSYSWDSGLKSAPLEASCFRTKSVLPLYSRGSSPSMTVTSACIIENRTARDQPLVGSIAYDAILRAPDGGMVRRTKVSLASSEKVIPAHGRIEGGLWTNTECPSGESPASCLGNWLGNANELILVAEGARAVVYVRMDRDKDPLGILK
jgi:hypothetical protein